jgi:hypothetical protein
MRCMEKLLKMKSNSIHRKEEKKSIIIHKTSCKPVRCTEKLLKMKSKELLV